MDCARTSERRELAPAGSPGDAAELLRGDFPAPDWYVVEAQSLDNQPFDLRAQWSGTTAGAWARITVSSAARLCVLARSLALSATNLSSHTNTALVQVGRGHIQTTNVWEYRGGTTAGIPLLVPMPPFAVRVRTELATWNALSGAWLSLLDGQGTVRVRMPAGHQPECGLAVGGAATLAIESEAATALRVLFTLSL